MFIFNVTTIIETVLLLFFLLLILGAMAKAWLQDVLRGRKKRR
jgi:hypothetical protein